MPVDLDRARDVAGLVEQHVFIGLDDDEAGRAEVGLEPVARDEPLWMGEVGELWCCVDFDGHDYLRVLK